MTFSLSEVAGRAHLEPGSDESAVKFIERKLDAGRPEQDLMEHLVLFSGFPEPFLKADMAFYHRWQREMVDALTSCPPTAKISLAPSGRKGRAIFSTGDAAESQPSASKTTSRSS